jgi:dolichyl-phosphate-mannose-protein mannosyltransferase
MLPALLGSFQVPIVYSIMRETGHAPPIAALSACMLALGELNISFTTNECSQCPTSDNGHIAQDRLILLDATLVFFMISSLYSYIMFHKQRYNEFSTRWWVWMLATGVSLAMTMSCKMVGLLTFMTVGTAVAIDLWKLLDIRRGLPIVRDNVCDRG